jgi:hypothetical protein
MRLTVRDILLMCWLLATIGCERASNANPGPAAGAPRVTSVRGNGVVRGTVAFIGTPPVMKTIRNHPCCQGAPPTLLEEHVVVNPNGTLRNVFVYLEGGSLVDGSSLSPALLDQLHCRYVPHTLGVQVGQPLRVRSSDATLHNVHYVPDKNRAGNLAMTQAGHEKQITFEHPEFIRMKCDVHPWMTAWVGVFDNPFFAVTRDDGAFEIQGIPAGTYRLVAWHEMYGKQEQPVTVSDDGPIETGFSFGKQQEEARAGRAPAEISAGTNSP